MAVPSRPRPPDAPRARARVDEYLHRVHPGAARSRSRTRASIGYARPAEAPRSYLDSRRRRRARRSRVRIRGRGHLFVVAVPQRPGAFAPSQRRRGVTFTIACWNGGYARRAPGRRTAVDRVGHRGVSPSCVSLAESGASSCRSCDATNGAATLIPGSPSPRAERNAASRSPPPRMLCRVAACARRQLHARQVSGDSQMRGLALPRPRRAVDIGEFSRSASSTTPRPRLDTPRAEARVSLDGRRPCRPTPSSRRPRRGGPRQPAPWLLRRR